MKDLLINLWAKGLNDFELIKAQRMAKGMAIGTVATMEACGGWVMFTRLHHGYLLGNHVRY